jgi:translation initiation factor IF-3
LAIVPGKRTTSTGAPSGASHGGNKVRINHHITAYEVRLVDPKGIIKDIRGEPDLTQIGIMSREQALAKARYLQMDLVEISPTASPPVVQIMDFGKFLFEEKKNRRKQPVAKLKEIKMRPVTDDGDYQVKLRNLMGFLQHGDKVKVTLRFRGREIAHHDLGLDLLKRLEVDIASMGIVEQMPKLEGKQLTMMISPKKGIAQQPRPPITKDMKVGKLMNSGAQSEQES